MRPILLMGQERPLAQVKYNRDGDLIITVGMDHIASVWYSMNGERLGTLEGHKGALFSVDIDDDSEYCATGSADFSVKVWRVKNGTEVHTWQTPGIPRKVEFSPKGDKILIMLDTAMSHRGSIAVYDIIRDSFNQISDFAKEPSLQIFTQEGFTPATVAAWSYNGKYIIAGHADGLLTKYDATTGQMLKQLSIHKKVVTDIQFSLDRTYFITASRDTNAFLIDVETFEVLKHYETDVPLNSACITPLKEFVILGGGQAARDVTTTSAREGRFEAKFYHKLFQVQIGKLDGHFGPINTLAVSPQGTSYASGGEDGFVRLHHFDKSYFDFKFDVEKTANPEKMFELETTPQPQ